MTHQTFIQHIADVLVALIRSSNGVPVKLSEGNAKWLAVQISNGLQERIGGQQVFIPKPYASFPPAGEGDKDDCRALADPASAKLTIGNRLREERERLGLSQPALGEIGGVKKLAQINYEKNERRPDAGYLAAIAVAGADVLYILTGQRNPHHGRTALRARRDGHAAPCRGDAMIADVIDRINELQAAMDRDVTAAMRRYPNRQEDVRRLLLEDAGVVASTPELASLRAELGLPRPIAAHADELGQLSRRLYRARGHGTAFGPATGD